MRKITPLTVGLCLLGAISMPAWADTTTTTDQESARADKMEQQLVALEKEVHTLKSELDANKKAAQQKARKTARAPASTTQAPAASNTNTTNISAPARSWPVNLDYDVPGRSFVSSGPYLGVQFQYNGYDLVINAPSVNEDVALLKLRKNILDSYQQQGIDSVEDHSHVVLSGNIEGQAWENSRSSTGGYNSDIDLTNAELDAYILGPSNWTSGVIEMVYDNTPGAIEGSLNSNARSQNSRMFIAQAFVTIGDFQKSPFYGTFGQMYVPFGQYSYSVISNPLTKLMARTEDRAIVLGYQQQAPNALYAATYIFKGDSYVGSTQRVNDGGINLGYKFDAHNGLTGEIGGGVIGNIADSQGMQNNQVYSTAAPFTFSGFGGTDGSGNEQLVHRVPAYDLRGSLSFGNYDLVAEYITASTSFSPADMAYNGVGAKPQALNVEGDYTLTCLPRPSSIGLAYGMTKEALALTIPSQRYSVVFNTSIWRNTVEALEFRHDINYAASDSSSGSLVPGSTTNLGKSDNVVTAQFDLYF